MGSKYLYHCVTAQLIFSISGESPNPFESMDPKTVKYEKEALVRLATRLDSVAKEDPIRGPIFFFLALFYELRYRRTGHSDDYRQWNKASQEAERFLEREDTPSDIKFNQYRIFLSLLLLTTKFKFGKDLKDLETVIQRATAEINSERNASDTPFQVDLMAIKIMLLNLRFARTRTLNDLNDIINSLRKILEFTTNEDEKAVRLNTLGVALQLRSECQARFNVPSAQVIIDVNDAVVAFNQAVALTPGDHSSRAARLSRLSYALKSRFQWMRNEADLHKAIEIIKGALDLAAEAQPQRESLICTLDATSFDKYELTGGPETAATLEAISNAFQIITKSSEDWPIDPNLPESQRKAASGNDVKDVLKWTRHVLDTYRPSNEGLANALGEILGSAASSSGDVYSSTFTVDTKRKNQSRSKNHLIPGTKGLSNLGMFKPLQ